MKKLAYASALISVVLSSLLFLPLRAPAELALAVPKALAGALSPFVAGLGLLGAVLGLLLHAPVAAITGALGALASARYVRRVTAPHAGFRLAFGENWPTLLASKITPDQSLSMLPRRWSWVMPPAPEPHWERDLPFWTDPATGETLVCDLWTPPVGVQHTGLVFIYFQHRGGRLMEKDINRQPFLRHLAAQGHVVMDANYRRVEGASLQDMLGDVKRAIAWMRANAARLGVRPDRIVVGGAAEAGHLALLAAYAPGHPELTPADLLEQDLRVQGVVAQYAPVDVAEAYQYVLPPAQPAGQPLAQQGLRRTASRVTSRAALRLGYGDPQAAWEQRLGGAPETQPEAYRLYSPLAHAGAGSPPTLLVQGEDDSLTPLMPARRLYGKLAAHGVPAMVVAFPQTEHAFDLFLPRYSPSAQAALYDVERFLALIQ